MLKSWLEHDPKFNSYKSDKREALPELGRIGLLKIIYSFDKMKYV